MAEKLKDLEPHLKTLYNYVDESGEKGIRLDELLIKLNKEEDGIDIILDIMDDLIKLGELGYIHREFVTERSERWVTTEIRWFAAGKGESISSEGPVLGSPF